MSTSMKKNIARIAVLVVMLCITCTNVIYAATNIGGVQVNTQVSVNTSELEDTASRVIGVIQVVGILIAVGVIMVLGIKYMMGSAEEKAEYKKVFVPYLIGAIILFAASALAGGLYNMINGF